MALWAGQDVIHRPQKYHLPQDAHLPAGNGICVICQGTQLWGALGARIPGLTRHTSDQAQELFLTGGPLALGPPVHVSCFLLMVWGLQDAGVLAWRPAVRRPGCDVCGPSWMERKGEHTELSARCRHRGEQPAGGALGGPMSL